LTDTAPAVAEPGTITSPADSTEAVETSQEPKSKRKPRKKTEDSVMQSAEIPVQYPEAAAGLNISNNVYEERVRQAAAQMDAAEAEMNPPPALVLLSQRLGLSRFEKEILLLCVAQELDTRIATLCGQVQSNAARSYPTFALALSIFSDPAWEALSPERPLRYLRLLEINQPGSQPLTTSALRVDERIVNYVKGLNYLDDRLTPLVAPAGLNHDEERLPPSQHFIVDMILHRWDQSASQLPVVQLLGSDEPSKRLVASHVAISLGLHLYRLPIDLMPMQTGDLETFTRLWERESRLLPLALYIDSQEEDVAGGRGEQASNHPASPISAARRFLSHCSSPVFLASRERWQHLEHDSFSLDVAKPTAAEQCAAWAAALEEKNWQAPELPEHLSAQFNFDLATIRHIVKDAAEIVDTDQTRVHPSTPQQLWALSRSHARPRLESLAQRLEPKVTWDDIVLPNEEMQTLRQIAGQVSQRTKVYQEWGFAKKMNRGFGISVLFAGESGTGKTMAAEVIANDLCLDLYRIDLSAVVNKYIGETEKNLRRLFDAAEDGGAILFFDEADALFGKRSEVKDSHDRYANIEINYLLQRIESYRGLAILATNMKGALDTAFMRRLRFIVDFRAPAAAQRKIIWQKVFPPETLTEGLGFDRLARLNLTGGLIHNIALNAAFLAAQSGTAVTMGLVLIAARAEFRKLDRPINEGDFRLLEQAATGAGAQA